MHIVYAPLRNAITCLYGNSASNYFGIEPPVEVLNVITVLNVIKS